MRSKYSEGFSEWFRKQLYFCYLEARKNKRKTHDEHDFEMFDQENLGLLADSVLAERYEPGAGIAFVTTWPVIREIFAAPFRDRVIHHFLYNSVAEWWDRRFIYDSYSCRPGKGNLEGVMRLSQMMRQVSRNYEREAFVIKMDISGFFMSLKRDRLYERVCWGLDRQMKPGSELLRLNKYLWAKIIFDDPTIKVRKHGNLDLWKLVPSEKSLYEQPKGQGIVIGNLTSQELSNIYLDQLDRLIKIQLGYKYYGRYVDDFFVVVTPEEKERFVKRDLLLVKEYLLGMGLVVHPHKTVIQPVKYGTTFLGAKIGPGYITLADRTIKNMRRLIREFGRDRATIEQMTSVLGIAHNYNTVKQLSRLFAEAGWEYLP